MKNSNSLNFSLRIGDYEISYNSEGDQRIHFPELKKWEKNNNGRDYCYTVAMWEKTREGYEFHSVGERLFEFFEDDEETALKLMKYCKVFNKVLDEWQLN